MPFFKRFRRTPPPPASPRERDPEPEPIRVPELTPQQVAEALQGESPPILLDVRQSWDYAAMRPKGARSLPLNELPARLGELDPAQRYVLSCYHGYTSLDGAAYLIERGFQEVASMSGGFAGWAAAHLPIERE